MNEASLRATLMLLAAATVGATLVKAVSHGAPAPREQPPAQLQLPGYRADPLATKPGRRGRDLSTNTLRQWRLVPVTGEAPLTLTLVPVRARNFIDLQMAAFPSLDPDLSLYQRRLSSPDPQPSERAAAEQFALGRQRTDANGSTTRLQSCITPGGPAGVTGLLLTRHLEDQRRAEEQQAPIRTALSRVTGLAEHSRWECLAVQLATPAGPHSEQHLRRAWASVRQALRSGT